MQIHIFQIGRSKRERYAVFVQVNQVLPVNLLVATRLFPYKSQQKNKGKQGSLDQEAGGGSHASLALATAPIQYSTFRKLGQSLYGDLAHFGVSRRSVLALSSILFPPVLAAIYVSTTSPYWAKDGYLLPYAKLELYAVWSCLFKARSFGLEV